MATETDRSPMHLSRRTMLFGGLLVGTSAAAAGVKFRETIQRPVREPLKDTIPERLGDWAMLDSENVVRPPEEAEKSIYDQEVSRVYAAGDFPPVMLLIAYGSTQSDTLQVHRPEFCYPAAGFDLGESRPAAIPIGGGRSVPAAFFTATRDQRVEHVLYWTRLGDQFPTSWLGQHWSRLSNSVRGLIPDGILVRASVIAPDAEAAQLQLSAFLRQLIRNASPVGKRALLG